VASRPSNTSLVHRRSTIFISLQYSSLHFYWCSYIPFTDAQSGCIRKSQVYPEGYIFAFCKRVEDYQLERKSVGLPEIPDDELVIGILNRLKMSRYAALVKDYLDNQRRGIAELPELPSTLWNKIEDTQIVRPRGTSNSNLQSLAMRVLMNLIGET
jgi:hypothetical protein